MCADGTLFAKTCTSTVEGLVAAFDRADLNEDTCPEGWEPFVDGRGRVIVGAGDPSASAGQLGVDEVGVPLGDYMVKCRTIGDRNIAQFRRKS